MSIGPIVGTDTNSNIGTKLAGATAAGAVLGGAYTAKDKHWLYKGTPSDSFVKKVSNNLKKEMSNEELSESSKVYRFVEKIVDPATELESLKPLIIDSKELSAAIKNNPDEKLEDAISRVFSQPESKIKQDLINLQYKTKCDKKFGKNTASKLIHDNFDAKSRKLVKNESTSDAVFKMIKSTARKVQAKSIVIGAALTGLATGALALILTDVPDNT